MALYKIKEIIAAKNLVNEQIALEESLKKAVMPGPSIAFDIRP